MKDLKEIWDNLKNICIEVGQRIVYLILKNLLYYPKIIKSKGYGMPIMLIFVKVKYFYKCLHIAMMPNQDLGNTIVIMIVHDSLYKDFDMATANLLEVNNKTID